MVLTLGIISLVMVLFSLVTTILGGSVGVCCCCPVGWAPGAVFDVVTLALAVPAAILGHVDLKAIAAGKMDPSGRGMTQMGYIMGIISAVLAVVILVITIIYFVVIMGLLMMQQPQPM
jgi:hypothetical protein